MDDRVIFTTVPDLLDFLRVTFDPKVSSSYDKRFEVIRNAPLLVLDNVRMDSATTWAKEKLFQILDYRYVKKLPTIITTSQKIHELNHQLRSRVLDKRLCTIFAITARSYTDRMHSID